MARAGAQFHGTVRRVGAYADHSAVLDDEILDVVAVADVHAQALGHTGVVGDHAFAAVHVANMQAAPEQVGSVRFLVSLALIHQAVLQAEAVQPTQGVAHLVDEDLCEFGVVAALGHALQVGAVLLLGVWGDHGDRVTLIVLDQVLEAVQAVVRDARGACGIEAVATCLLG
jgi:hypothetical protein